MKSKIFRFILLLSLVTVFLSGCRARNTYFDYIKNGNVNKIIIRNVRDKGLRFIISDTDKIDSIYKILSSSKEVKSKSSLEPDYIIDIYENNEVTHSLNYVIGVSNESQGNLYNDKNIFNVSKKLDEDIFSYLEDIRKPKDFNTVYYDSIEKAVDKYNTDNSNNGEISFNVNSDEEVQKFIYSSELEKFKGNMGNKIAVLDKNQKAGNIELSIKTIGYKNYTDKGVFKAIFKAIATFKDNNSFKEKQYWISNQYDNNNWSYSITAEKPNGF